MLRILFIAVGLFLVGCSNPEITNQKESKEVIYNQSAISIANKLDVPWAITKQNNTFYISERKGFIVTVNEDNPKLERSVVKTKWPIHQEGEGGFLGIELSPSFEQTHQAFAYHTYQENGSTFNRVILIQKKGDNWIEVRELLARIPGETIHNGGRIKLGPDQKLYVSTGDAAVPNNAQNKNSLSGKILRLNLDGSIPQDNPYPDSYVYSYGHRNPQGLAWDEQGNMYSSEHGQSAHDEINEIKAGHNYGWPIIEGSVQREGLDSPLFQTKDITWAPSGIQYMKGKLYIATLRGESVRELNLQNKTSKKLIGDIGRVRDVYIEGDYLYFISNNLDGRGSPREFDDQIFKVNVSK